MQNLILIISFSFFYIQTINAQYLPLVKENAKWSGIHSSGYDDESWQSGYYDIIKGDTIINGLNYKKVYQKSTWYENTNWNTSNATIISIVWGNYNSPEELIGVIREDTTARKVYFIGLSEYLPCLYDGSAGIMPLNEEYLLYDFDVNIEIGDTLYFGAQSPPYPVVQVVESIDIVQYSDNIIRKRYLMEYGGRDYYYVEGVGGYNGLFGSLDTGQELLAGSCELNCFSDNNSYLIGDGYYPCDSIEAGVYNDVNDIHQVNWTSKVSPNPFHNRINIEISSPSFQTINFRVLNLLGHEVFNKDLYLLDQTIDIPTENWETGFYTIILTNKLSHKQVYKVIKY